MLKFQDLSQLRVLRKKLGLAQSQLSHLSGVSLPFIQQIEAGDANPSLKTLQSLGNILGLKIDLKIEEPDWNKLAACGAPLLSIRSNKFFRPSEERLIHLLRNACIFLSNRRDQLAGSRELDAVQALLLGIKNHYPSVYRRYFSKSPLVNSFVPMQVSGRIRKLSRIAVERISKFL
ncbi:MAG: hypothetical protein JWQ35_201 [Bacteriovoracaceae bacterium]|nr:hypothetical protein [Bacteriovoracaceae bacterium]